MKWFKHDSNANRDAKLIKLRMKYGIEGYGLYWYCLEIIADSINENNYTFELEHDAEVIGFNIGMHSEKVQEIMVYMVKLNLFQDHQGVITCLKLAKRLDQSMTSNPQMRKIISNFKQNHDSIMTQSCPDQIRLDQNRKDLKTKRVTFKKPTIEEIQKHIAENNLDIDAEEFFYHYETNDWFRGKTKIKSWKACLQTWKRKNKGNDNAKIDKRTRAQRVSDKLDEIAREDIEKNGVTEFLD